MRDTALPSPPPAGVAGRGAEFRGGKLGLDRLDPDERTVDRSQFEVDRRRRTVYDPAGCYRRAGAADRHQATAAASAYETAFAATVPPPLIVANRSLLAPLVATNILGQNAPATAATEAYDAEMWGPGRRRRVQLRRRLRPTASQATPPPAPDRRNDHVSGRAISKCLWARVARIAAGPGSPRLGHRFVVSSSWTGSVVQHVFQLLTTGSTATACPGVSPRPTNRGRPSYRPGSGIGGMAQARPRSRGYG